MEDKLNHKIWVENEIRRNQDFIKALDETGHYLTLSAEDSDREYYIDDYVSDDEFNALVNQLKAYLMGNIEHWKNHLRELEYEESNLQGRDDGHGGGIHQ